MGTCEYSIEMDIVSNVLSLSVQQCGSTCIWVFRHLFVCTHAHTRAHRTAVFFCHRILGNVPAQASFPGLQSVSADGGGRMPYDHDALLYISVLECKDAHLRRVHFSSKHVIDCRCAATNFVRTCPCTKAYAPAVCRSSSANAGKRVHGWVNKGAFKRIGLDCRLVLSPGLRMIPLLFSYFIYVETNPVSVYVYILRMCARVPTGTKIQRKDQARKRSST